MKVSPQRHNLARLRLALDLRQEEFAQIIGCPRPTLQSIEHGRVALIEEIAERVAEQTGVSVGWLLQNDLTAPIVSRWGTAYGLEHYLLAQLSVAPGSHELPAHYNGADAAFEEEILMAVARLKQVYDNLTTQRNKQEIVSVRLRKFLKSLEEDFGPNSLVTSMDWENESECVNWGKVVAGALLKQTKMPQRWYELEIRRREAEAIDQEVLADLKLRLSGLKPAQIPKLIQTMRDRAVEIRQQLLDERKHQPLPLDSPIGMSKP